jgi:hypothetical protein
LFNATTRVAIIGLASQTAQTAQAGLSVRDIVATGLAAFGIDASSKAEHSVNAR